MADLYSTDPYAWALAEAEKLRAVARTHPSLGLDFLHLVEELDSMAGADRRRVEKLARMIMQHLLLLAYSPAPDPRRRWQSELIEFRQQLREELTGVLESHLGERLDAVYGAAREAIQPKMQLFGETQAAARLPTARPYSLEQLPDQDWLPPQAS
jgi:hypothetical protein